MQIRCSNCGRAITIASTGVLPDRCPHCEMAPVPERLGKWRVERLIAAGGMGEVYLARHHQLGSRVAIKLLPHGAGLADAALLRERFAREARLTAAIDHPGVVHVLDFETVDDRAFLVLEYLRGRSLRSVLRDGPLTIARAVEVAADVANVLAAAHVRGVVHRDVKPENVLIEPDGSVRVLDFGIARALMDQDTLTRTGEILGTPEYMAPEQLLEAASAVDARADVHALGILLHELLTGHSPFHGSNLFQVLKLVESYEPRAPSTQRADVGPDLDAVVARALAKRPDERFVDAAAFGAALRAAFPGAASVGRRPSARPAWTLPVLLVVALAFGLTIGRWLAVGDDVDRRSVPASVTEVAPLERARDELHEGRFLSAATALDAAARSGDGAAVELAAVAWVCAHLVMPTAAGVPDWVAATDRPQRDRLLGIGDDAPANPSTTAIARSIRALLGDDAAAAYALLRPAEGVVLDDVTATIALLAARRACADRVVLRRTVARLRPARPGAAFRILAASVESRAALRQELQDLAESLPAEAAERWLAELYGAFVAAEPERMRAAAELAWLTGAHELAPINFVGLRVQLATSVAGHAIASRDADGLARLLDGFSAEDHPAVAVGRALLGSAAGRAPEVAVALRALPVRAEPGLAPFQSWRDALVVGDADATRLGGALAMALVGRDSAMELRALVDRPMPCGPSARLLLAALGSGSADDWRQAVDGGADVALLGVLPDFGDGAMRLAPDVVMWGTMIDEGQARTPESVAAWLRVLRHAARCGVDLGRFEALREGPLRARFIAEVQGGIDD